MKDKILQFVTLAGAFVTGCSFFLAGCSFQDPTINMAPPVYVEQLEGARQEQKSDTGGLFGGGSNPLFSDNKAMRVHDIVTVIISEKTNQQSKASKSTARENNTNLGGGIFGGASGSKLSKALDVSFRSNSGNSFNGSGQQSRNETFATTISARIIKVLENGNYFIEGRKQILVNGEKQIMQISGVIRPYDISGQNTIESKYIADAKILYTTQGELDRATKKPWGSKVLESVWPF